LIKTPAEDQTKFRGSSFRPGSIAEERLPHVASTLIIGMAQMAGSTV
jgi:hypothetical protein